MQVHYCQRSVSQSLGKGRKKYQLAPWARLPSTILRVPAAATDSCCAPLQRELRRERELAAPTTEEYGPRVSTGSPPGALRGPGHCKAKRGWKPSEAQASGKPRRSSPSGSTALFSASTAAAIAAHAVPQPSAIPRSPKAPPLLLQRTGALMTSHLAERGGKGERLCFGQSWARICGPASRRARGEGAGPG